MYEGADFYAHMIEHCCNQIFPLTPKTFFTSVYPLTCELHQGIWLEIAIPHHIAYQHVLKLLDRPLEEALIKQELRALRDELPNQKGVYDNVCDAVGKKLYGTYTRGKITKYSVASLQAYHHKYVRNGKWLVTDIYEKLIATNISSKTKVAPRKLTSLHLQEIAIQKHRFSTRTSPVSSLSNYLFLDFLSELCTYYEVYQYRFQQAEYHYDESDFNFYPKHFSIVLPAKNTYNRDRTFFNEAKKNYLNQIHMQYGKKMFRIRELLTGKRLDEKKCIAFVEALTYEDVRRHAELE
jgi:hypothetical protein